MKNSNGVQNVFTAPAVKKFIIGDKLVIVNGDAEYNAVGAQVK